MTFRLGLLIVVVCIALSSCSKLFSPRGRGEIPDTDQTATLLKAHVFHLADTIGERNVYHPGSMERSARYIEPVSYTHLLAPHAHLLNKVVRV